MEIPKKHLLIKKIQNMTDDEKKVYLDHKKEQDRIRQKRYLEKKKEAGTYDEYKQKNAEYMKQYRETINKALGVVPKSDKVDIIIKKPVNDIQPVQDIKPVQDIQPVQDNTKLLSIDMLLFDDIDYNVICKPKWFKDNLKTEKDFKDAKQMNDKTKKGYLSNIKTIYNKYFKSEDLNDNKLKLYNHILNGEKLSTDNINYLKTNDDFIADPDNFLKHLKYLANEYKKENKANSTFINSLKAIIAITSRIEYDNDFKTNYNIASNVMNRFSIYQNDHNKKGIAKKHDVNGDKVEIDYNNFDYSLELINNSKIIEEKALVSLYVLSSPLPRRIEDYQYMVLAKEGDDISNTDINYMLITNDIFKLIFNKYKTSSTYGNMIYIIENDFVKQRLNDHIQCNKIQKGHYVFGKKNKRSEPLIKLDGYLSICLENIFKKKLTLNDIRHSAINSFMNDAKLSRLDKEAKAREMGTSFDEASKYHTVK
tara:strand:+ start:1036 stop:2475 length:1440 start_codon:yes stop_codon:yes gene_type:complete